MSKGYAATDAKPLPRLIFTVLFVLSLASIVLLGSAIATHSAIPTPGPTPTPIVVEVEKTKIVIASMTPTATLPSWAKTATALPTATKVPWVATWTPTPQFAGRETTGRMSER